MAKTTFTGKLHIKTGDTVIVLAGKDKGRTGSVTRVFPETGKVIVSGINIVTKHEKGTPTPTNPQPEGGIVKVEAPLPSCKVALVTKDGQPTRVRTAEVDGKKVRVSTKTGETL